MTTLEWLVLLALLLTACGGWWGRPRFGYYAGLLPLLLLVLLILLLTHTINVSF